MRVTVKNLGGSSKCKHPDGWINVWLKYIGLREWDVCLNCGEEGDVEGGHVHKIPDDGFCYIVPLCARCNNPENTESFDVGDNMLMPISSTRCDDRVTGRCDR